MSANRQHHNAWALARLLAVLDSVTQQKKQRMHHCGQGSLRSIDTWQRRENHAGISQTPG